MNQLNLLRFLPEAIWETEIHNTTQQDFSHLLNLNLLLKTIHGDILMKDVAHKQCFIKTTSCINLPIALKWGCPLGSAGNPNTCVRTTLPHCTLHHTVLNQIFQKGSKLIFLGSCKVYDVSCIFKPICFFLSLYHDEMREMSMFCAETFLKRQMFCQIWISRILWQSYYAG